ncbi:FadR/GntR family transcriptional regulator [Kineosporia babensis]|uniref:FadR family transcriptional regulator n=1 Tax=Kineosporia babensis TaxID=499548 RepID=A0A9X1NGU3_9ACTN|nr:FadR/GntR family transcriptional regulator [Kineosporia babensis]MCD5314867.1 FadR family transcriptional regulator [Kineosporia babensis]
MSSDDSFRPAVRGLLTERIARQLENDIREGTLAADTKLPSERELAQRFGASRNVVREVLRRLEAQDLIDVQPGRGSFVTARGTRSPFGTERPTVRQLIEARIPIEVEIAGLAAQRAGAAEIAVITQAHQRVLDAPDAAAKARADLTFHEALAAASGNPVLRVMLSSIGGPMFEMMLRSNSDPAIAEPGVPHHAEILDAIIHHDAPKARSHMHEHLALGLRTYGADLDVSLDVMATRHLDQLLKQV